MTDHEKQLTLRLSNDGAFAQSLGLKNGHTAAQALAAALAIYPDPNPAPAEPAELEQPQG